MHFALSIVVLRMYLGTAQVRHTCIVTTGATLDEAVGKATRIGHKLYPPEDGWALHVVGKPVDEVAEPEDNIVLTGAV